MSQRAKDGKHRLLFVVKHSSWCAQSLSGCTDDTICTHKEQWRSLTSEIIFDIVHKVSPSEGLST